VTSTHCAEHARYLSVVIRHGEQRNARAQILVQLVRNLKWLILGEEQQEIRIGHDLETGLSRYPVVKVEKLCDSELTCHSLQGDAFVPTAVSYKINPQIGWSQFKPLLHGCEGNQERPWVSTEVEATSVDHSERTMFT
jgi:hypothetical protein